MLARISTLGVFAALAFALSATLAGQAGAVTCSESFTATTSTTSATDCAGRSVSVTFDTYYVMLSHSGDWDGNSWFSDLHITIAGSSFFDTGSSFTNVSAGESWTKSLNSNTFSFVADDPSENVNPGAPGDTYNWTVNASFNEMQTSSLITIEYTMDVPEPALGIVLLGGLAAVALVRRRAA